MVQADLYVGFEFVEKFRLGLLPFHGFFAPCLVLLSPGAHLGHVSNFVEGVTNLVAEGVEKENSLLAVSLSVPMEHRQGPRNDVLGYNGHCLFYLRQFCATDIFEGRRVDACYPLMPSATGEVGELKVPPFRLEPA